MCLTYAGTNVSVRKHIFPGQKRSCQVLRLVSGPRGREGLMWRRGSLGRSEVGGLEGRSGVGEILREEKGARVREERGVEGQGRKVEEGRRE